MSRSPQADLSAEFLRFTGDAFALEQHALVEASIALAAHSLAVTDNWATLDARGFLANLDDRPMIRIEAAMYLIGFIGWLGITGRLAPSQAVMVMEELREQAPPSPLLSELLRMAAGHLMSAAA